MIGLVDADIIVFRAGFAAERNQWYLKILLRDEDTQPKEFQYKKDAVAYLDERLPGIHSRVEGEDYQLWSERKLEPVDHALHNVNVTIHKIKDKLGLEDDDLHMYLSGGENFRFAVAKTKPYKGTRDKSHRPTHEAAIRTFIASKWQTTITDGIEADDALGIAQGPDSIIISVDKDLKMIPGEHYDFVKDVRSTVTPGEGIENFCMQLLTGDATDNIPGLPKVGKVKAQKILDGIPAERMLNVVVREYASRGPQDWFEYLNEQACLLWIRQTEEEGLFRFDDSFRDIGGEPDEAVTTDLYG